MEGCEWLGDVPGLILLCLTKPLTSESWDEGTWVKLIQ